MKKILFVNPKIELELKTTPILFKILWRSIRRGKTKFKFYKSQQELRGKEYNGAVIDEFVNPLKTKL